MTRYKTRHRLLEKRPNRYIHEKQRCKVCNKLLDFKYKRKNFTCYYHVNMSKLKKCRVCGEYLHDAVKTNLCKKHRIKSDATNL